MKIKHYEIFMRNKFYVIFFVLFVTAFSGCCGSKETIREPQYLKYEITLGSGGGFTGISEGEMIDTLGIVYHWEGRSFLTSVKKNVDTLSQHQIIKLNKFFSENGLINYHFKESGNITSFLTLSDSNKDLTFSWKEANIPERVPEKIRELFYLINQAVEQNKKEVQK